MPDKPSRFTTLTAETRHREERPSTHGLELRWKLNYETIRDEETGLVISRGAIRHPGICVIVPRLTDGRILLMRQYRYPIGASIWELPAGTLSGREDGAGVVASEDPADCARREVLEETGYRAGRIEKLGWCHAMPGSSDEVIHIFLAEDLTPEEQSLDPGEVIEEVRPFSVSEIAAMIAAGEIADAKTLVGLTMLLSRQPEGLRISTD